METINAYNKGVKYTLVVDNGITKKLHGFTLQFDPTTKSVKVYPLYNGEALLNRIITNATKDQVVSRKTNNCFDYRLSNFQISEKINDRTSKYIGVQKTHTKKKWEAKIKFPNGGKFVSLGTYDTPEQAALTYDYYSRTSRGLNTKKVNFHIFDIKQRSVIK